MKRLRGTVAWLRHGVHWGLLAGLGLAFIGSSEPTASAEGTCPLEGECTFKKPNFMIIMDYSSSMNEEFDMVNNVSRWQASVDAVQNLMVADNSFFSENMHIALMRFGHDPQPGSSGTTIGGDTSGIVDGQSIDVHWYDTFGADKTYYDCNGQAIIDSLDRTPDPLCLGPGCSGIGTWTNGALLAAQSAIDGSRIDHPADVTPGDERYYANVLMTDGLWSSQNGQNQGGPPTENPVHTADAMWTGYPMGQEVPTYVVALGDAMGQVFTDAIAAAGGTGQAIDAASPTDLVDALKQVVDDIKASVIIPECTGGLPRVMVILDASSSMLNVNGVAGTMGQTGWDQARDALAGNMSLFDVVVGTVGRPVEDLVHLGLLVFGGASPAEEKVLVDYGPCMKDNFAWALDPETSCDAPGCTDPWGGPSITWTFKDSPPEISPDGTPFDQDTHSHMPACLSGSVPGMCQGSGTYTHRGLALAASNQMAYFNNPPPLYPLDPTSLFINILITDGNYIGYSTHSQVRDELVAMFNNDITTYVIGLGDGPDQTLLDTMACWGSGGDGVPSCSGGTIPAYSAATQQDLENALKNIIDGLSFDPCCAFNDCSVTPEPTTGEPDTTTGGGSGSTGTGSTTGGTGTTTGTTGTTGGSGSGTGASSTGGSTGGVSTSGSSTAGGTGTTSSGSGTGGGSGVSSSGAGGSGSASGTSGGSATTSGSAGGTDSGTTSGSGSTETDGHTTTATATDGIDTDGDSAGDAAGALDDDGCGCRSSDPRHGPLSVFLGLGLLGLGRRRRS